MSSLKIGFVGTGKHARANIYPSLQLLGIPIHSICAKHLENAQKAVHDFGAEKAYDDYHAMLDRDNLDALFVVTSGQLHASIVLDALQAGVNVFVEKPLGWTELEAKEVAKVSLAAGKKVMVGFMKRFSPSYRKMKELMNRRESFGEILSLTGMFGMRSFGPNDEPWIKYNAIHYIDLIRYFAGEVRELHGFKRNTDEGLDQVFSFATESGIIGNMMLAGLPSWGRHYEEITITGTRGFMKTENMKNIVTHSPGEAESQKPRWQLIDEKDEIYTSIDTSSSGGWKDLYINGYIGEVEHFLDCIRNDKEPESSASDNINTMALCEEILLQLKNPEYR